VLFRRGQKAVVMFIIVRGRVIRTRVWAGRINRPSRYPHAEKLRHHCNGH
jgi:hypothetical protein